MIVVDANIVIYLVCQTPWTNLAQRVYSTDNEWIVPELWEFEVLNGLTVMKRGGLLNLDDAIHAWSNASNLLAGRVRKCDPLSVLRTADRDGLSAYDAQYVTLARSLGVKVITEDRRIQTNCQDVARSLRVFLGLPEEPSLVKEKRTAYRTTRRKK